MASVLGDPSSWGRGVLWTFGALLIAMGTLTGWAFFTACLREVIFASVDLDWYSGWWVKGAVVIPGLLLEVAFAWGAAVALRRLLGERGAAWFAPLWVTVVGLGPLLVLVIWWLPDVLRLL